MVLPSCFPFFADAAADDAAAARDAAAADATAEAAVEAAAEPGTRRLRGGPVDCPAAWAGEGGPVTVPPT